MKKTIMRINRIIVMCLVATCLLTSCNKKNPDDNVPEDGFVATIEQNGGDSNGRTHINPASWADETHVGVLWTKNDLIKVANNGGATGCQTLTYQLTEGEDTKRGVFYTGAPHENFFQPNYVAIYPAKNAADEANTISGTTATFKLPATQTYKENSFAEKCQPMVAYSTTQTLQFKNVLGCICFPLVGQNIMLTKIVLTSKNSSDRLWGTCTTTISTSGAPTNTTMADGSNSITLNCGTVTLDPVTPKYFCIIVPPGTLASGFTVAMYNGSAMINEISTNKDARIRRSVISETSNITVAAQEPDPVFAEKEFTVAKSGTNNYTKVYFSPGNLQYKANTGTNTDWRFAENQWDYVGGWNTSTWIDLFGWATSGWENGPLTTTQSNASYYINGQGRDMAGTHADWGVHNSIYNPKTNHTDNHTDAAGTWRTLTQAEWTYLFNTRSASRVNNVNNARYAKAIVNSVPGVILFPDEYTHPSGVTQPTGINSTNAGWNGNNYNASDFGKMEAAGAVFLPAAGYRDGTTVSEVGDNGYYWSSTHTQSTYNFGAYALKFSDGAVTPNFSPTFNFYGFPEACRYYGYSVRLVR